MKKKPNLEILFNKAQIQKRINEIGYSISKNFTTEIPILVCVLNGSFIFFADLIRSLSIDCEIDFLKVSSYQGKKTTGKITLEKDISFNINGRHIIIVEDIIDSGITVNFLLKKFKERNCRSISIVALLKKSNKFNFQLINKYIGFEIKQEFVVGFGLDYNQRFRNLKEIYILK